MGIQRRRREPSQVRGIKEVNENGGGHTETDGDGLKMKDKERQKEIKED